MKVLIIEDELPAQKRLKRQLAEIDEFIEVLDCLDSISSGIAWFQNNPDPDLLFLDIQLADGLSFKILEQVKTECPIIFCTAYDEYAIKAFKHNSIDYLLKPIDQADLEAALKKFQKNYGTKNQIDLQKLQEILTQPKKDYKQRFMVKIGEKIQSINIASIDYFYSDQKATFLKTKDNKKYLIDYPLDQLEELLDPAVYFRLNRKYITHHNAIDSVFSFSNSRLKVTLKNSDDDNILISREKVQKFKEWLDA
ncbi:LytR/AlgR family response regulator transcription factor [Fulvivirga lutea]|uniref:Response regulator transcription factor n=1 Tax=Fulvivirga lutea TaxID=2810512 RepID=A0A975A207_9BACT|nr:LytTR family DNA-binding domain-containing protein [Fulvivirga lutea]QSE98785.1 response regulator transcription factor [Fulvivirga lutea]